MPAITRTRAAAIRWAEAYPADCDGGWNIHQFAAGDITEQEFCERTGMFPPDSDGSWAATEIARQSRIRRV